MSDAAPDPEAQLRSLQRRLRRDKLALERLNPLERPDDYAAAFDHVVALEVQRRSLRSQVRDEDPVVVPDEDDSDDDASSEEE